MQTSLGHSRLLARPGERRLHLIDPTGALLLDLYREGWTPETLADLLAERFGLTSASAHAYVEAQMQRWQDAGLLDAIAETKGTWPLDSADDPLWPAPRPRPLTPGTWALRVADRRLGLRVSDPDLRATLRDWLAPAANLHEIDHDLVLAGPPAVWRLTLDGIDLERGAGRDTALVATLSTLTELGCRPAERLLVIHGAGLVAPDGRGLLLVAPGGSGKSTLTAALDAQGFGLLSDDVVPGTLDGDLLGHGLPLCLKAGSWPVLTRHRPELAQVPSVARCGQQVRFLAGTGGPARGPVRAACCLFPRYDPGHPGAVERLSPEQTLQGIIAAEAVVRDLTQTKLEALARWVSDLPAYAIRYPDLDRGLALVADLLAIGPDRTLALDPASAPDPDP